MGPVCRVGEDRVVGRNWRIVVLDQWNSGLVLVLMIQICIATDVVNVVNVVDAGDVVRAGGIGN